MRIPTKPVHAGSLHGNALPYAEGVPWPVTGGRIRKRKLSPEGRQRREAIGVPPDLIELPLWLVAQRMGTTVSKLNVALAAVELPQDQATTGKG